MYLQTKPCSLLMKATVGSCCGNNSVRYGMFVGPYQPQDVNADSLLPRIKPYTGISSYKNVKTGQYNREIPWTCGSYRGFPQAPGVYNLNIIDTPLQRPNMAVISAANEYYAMYQAERMRNDPGSYGISAPPTGYINYLNTEKYALHPLQYVKGNWPDEQLTHTNAPLKQPDYRRCGVPE